MNSRQLWITIALSGIGTFLIRHISMKLTRSGYGEKIKTVFSFIPPAVLSALVFGSVFEKGFSSFPENMPFVLAVFTAGFAAFKSRSILLTIAVGMVVILVWNLAFV